MAPSAKKMIPPAVFIIDGMLAAACLGLFIYGFVNRADTHGLVILGVGVLGLIIIGATLAAAWMIAELAGSSGASASRGATGSKSEQLLSHIYENSMLSDTAKRVLFRERELELLRRAIEDDIARGDYNAGLTLCEDLSNLFGHREEAEAFRTRIEQAGHAAIDTKAQEAMDQFDDILRTRDWARAHQEAARIRRLYPTHHLVQDIDIRIMTARDGHKRELEEQFLDAANREDVEQAMSCLKELDRYMTREEAGRLSNVAQEIVVKHRDKLIMRFRLAVNDHRWSEAAQVGDTIMAEYPNTKMADEVRSMIDVLRTRATQAAVASEG